MRNIDWIVFQNKKTLGERRSYLSSIFKERPKRVNKWFFAVNSVKSQENYRLYKRLGNLLRRGFRYAVLPFPITWTRKNSDRLLQKDVISMEEFIMGGSKPESFFSALRIGVNQYPAYLLGSAFALAGLVATLAVTATVTFGLVPIVSCGIGVAYLIYLAKRAQRKQAVTTGYLKLKKERLRRIKITKERLFVKMYTLVTLLERAKESIQNLSLEDSKEVVNEIIKEQTFVNGYTTGEEKVIVQLFAKVIEDSVDPFKKLSNEISKKELSDNLNVLISRLEEINIILKLDDIEQKSKENVMPLTSSFDDNLVEYHILGREISGKATQKVRRVSDESKIPSNGESSDDEGLTPFGKEIPIVRVSDKSLAPDVVEASKVELIECNEGEYSQSSVIKFERLAESSNKVAKKKSRKFKKELLFKKKSLIKNLIMNRIRRITNNEEIKYKLELNKILKSLLKSDKPNKSFIRKIINDSDLPNEYKNSLIRELEMEISQLKENLKLSYKSKSSSNYTNLNRSRVNGKRRGSQPQHVH